MSCRPTNQDTELTLCLSLPFKGIVRMYIPAYSSCKAGFVIPLSVVAQSHPMLEVTSTGRVAKSLEHMVNRAIHILSSIKPVYDALNHLKIHLVSTIDSVRVKDARSAGLPITIALLNIMRLLSGKESKQWLTGTGILRVDGSFCQSHYEQIKQTAVNEQPSYLRFTSSAQCQHVFELEQLLNQQTI